MKIEKLKVVRMKSIPEVLEEVEVLVYTHFFNELTRTKSSTFLNKVVENENLIEVGLLKTAEEFHVPTPKIPRPRKTGHGTRK